MNFNFELILFILVVVSGLISLFDWLFLAKNRKRTGEKMNWASEYAQSFFPVLLLVFVIRSFWFEPFRIPSGSLEPTLLPGDFIAVNKYYYGIRLPVSHRKIYSWHEPNRGDILIFRWPPAPQYDFIKRVIGLPGDHVSYISRVLTINGHAIPQEFVKNTQDTDESGTFGVIEKREDLFGLKHHIYQNLDRMSYDYKDIVVPQNMYFVMGDNRDDSMDSRYWGFVPEENIVGKASLIWMSWDSSTSSGSWSDRFDHLLHFWNYLQWNRLFKTVH